jgi:hypothetical protein
LKRAREKGRAKEQDRAEVREASRYNEENEILPSLQIRAPDVQAALTVLGRHGLWDGAAPPRLSNVDLRRADLVSANLNGAILSEAHLEGADLRNAQLEGADLSDVYLVGKGTLLINANMRNATLRSTQFEADFRFADLSEAKLTRTEFRGPLYEVRLNEAELNRADFTRATLLDTVDWKGAKDRDSDWPDNFTPEQRREKGIIQVGSPVGDSGGGDI